MAEPSSRSSATASLPGPSSQTAADLLACDAVATEAERCAHFRIRHQVFVIEQGLFGGSYGADGADTDVHDDDPATIHVIGRAGETICGTGRLYPLDACGRWKGDRLAVLASYRHRWLGWQRAGDLVDYAGIPHQRMLIDLTRP